MIVLFLWRLPPKLDLFRRTTRRHRSTTANWSRCWPSCRRWNERSWSHIWGELSFEQIAELVGRSSSGVHRPYQRALTLFGSNDQPDARQVEVNASTRIESPDDGWQGPSADPKWERLEGDKTAVEESSAPPTAPGPCGEKTRLPLLPIIDNMYVTVHEALWRRISTVDLGVAEIRNNMAGEDDRAGVSAWEPIAWFTPSTISGWSCWWSGWHLGKTSTEGRTSRRQPAATRPATKDACRTPCNPRRPTCGGEVAHRSGPATKATRKLADGFEQLIERQSHASRADAREGRSRKGRFRRAEFSAANRIQIDVQAAEPLQAFDDPLAAAVVVFARERVHSEQIRTSAATTPAVINPRLAFSDDRAAHTSRHPWCPRKNACAERTAFRPPINKSTIRASPITKCGCLSPVRRAALVGFVHCLAGGQHPRAFAADTMCNRFVLANAELPEVGDPGPQPHAIASSNNTGGDVGPTCPVR